MIRVGSLSEALGFEAALKRKKPWQQSLAKVFRQVDFIATPTLTVLPPRWFPVGSTAINEKLVFNAQNTVGINFAGNPAIAIPIAMPAKKNFIPRTSLQLVGPNRSEAQLINAARLVAARK